MVDILAIGSGAVNAYRQALSTTSNNIANVNTPGYTRRDLNIGESFPVKEGVFYFGSGASAQTIGRAYDEFIEKSLRDATSDLQVNEPVIQYANRIIDILGSKNSSLATAMDRFFNAAEQLSADPSAAPLRVDFLTASGVVADRFSDLSKQVDLIAEESELALRDSVDQLNVLNKQLFRVNEELNLKNDVDLQPPRLLDQRDKLLREISSLVKIGVTELENGQVIVNFGGTGKGFETVTPTGHREIGVFSDTKSGGTDLRLILDPASVKRPLPSAPSGVLGGGMAFRADVLRPIRVGLDHLAKTFAAEINDIHRTGMDRLGEFGGDLFRVTTRFVAQTDTVTGAISASAKVVDPSKAPTEALELMYIASLDSWEIRDLVTRERLGEISSGQNVEFQGISFDLTGSPVNGDVVIFSPEQRPARTFELLIDDIDRIAPAATMRVLPGLSNTSNSDATLSLIPKDKQPDGFEFGHKVANVGTTSTRQDHTVTASSLRPAIQIAEGTQNAQVLFDIAAGSNQKIQVLTRESVHVAGSALTSAEKGASGLMSLDSGFGEGTYSDTYLNKTGSDAYLDTSIQLGVEVGTRTIVQPVKDSDTGLITQVTSTVAPQIVSKTISPTSNSSGSTQTLVAAGAVKFNGQALGALQLANGATMSASAMASYFNSQFTSLSISGVTASAETMLRAESFDATKTLKINNVVISHTASATVDDVVQAINDKSASTNVRAEFNSDQGLVLTNTTGNEGANITLGTVGSDTVTSLGLVSRTYAGVYQIEATGVDSSTGLPSPNEISLTLGTGVPADLGQLGMATGVIIDGPVPDDLAIFVTGSGTVDVLLRADPATEAEPDYPADPFTVNFTSDSIYTITDTATNTVVAKRAFVAGQPIEFQGTQVALSDIPKSGDSFTVEANTDGFGSNENILRLIALGKQPLISGQTFSEAYLDLVGGAGSRSRMAQLNKEAMEVVRDQAHQSRESKVGVNLDEEATDLIRFQQAYQAAAQVIQVSQKIFDTLLRAG